MSLKSTKLVILILMSVIWLYIPVFAAKFIVQKADINNAFYSCPFDVNIMIDAWSQEIKWWSVSIDLQSWLKLEGVSFGDKINLSFPIRYDLQKSKLIAYWFKFPGSFTWVVKFLTLRLKQDDKIERNSIKFNWYNTWDTTDFMDIYPMWGADILDNIENQDFIFSDGDCPSVWLLSGDQFMSWFDANGHLMWLYNQIDGFLKDQNKFNLKDFIKNNIYYVISILLFIIILIVVGILYKKDKLQFLKNKKWNNVN